MCAVFFKSLQQLLVVSSLRRSLPLSLSLPLSISRARAFVSALGFAMYWHFQRLFVSFSLTLLLLLLWLELLFVAATATCNLQRATRNAQPFFATDFCHFAILPDALFDNFLKKQT